MSQALQRVIVRLMFDPAFVARVYGGAPVEELTTAERRVLLATDQRAWGADAYRRSRGLHALIEEFPVSSAVAGDGGARLGALDAFFSSPAFHTAIQERRDLALAFGGWVPAGPLAVVETALARARRHRPSRGSGLVCAPGVVPITVPEGAFARWQAIREQLGADPLARLVAGVALEVLPPLGPDPEHWICWSTPDGDVSLGGSSGGVNALLEAASQPVARPALEAAAIGLGAEPGEAAEIVDGLVEDGLVVER